MMQLDWTAATRNVLNFWLPEGIFKDEKREFMFMLLREDVSCNYHRTDGDGVRYDFEKPGLRLQGATRPIQDGVEMEMTIDNLSEEVWGKVMPGVCLQFHSAPDFYDPERHNTFYVSGGEIRFMDTDTGGEHFYGPRMLPELFPPADIPLIGIRSHDGEHTVAMYWEGGESVWGNAHRATLCVHADPIFGKISPGESVTRKGRIYLMPGTPEDALARYREEVGG